MATSFKGWLSSWLNSWGPQSQPDPNAMQGVARVTFAATGNLTSALAPANDMQGTASMSFGATGELLQPLTQYTPQQGAGGGFVKTSRYSDSDAYNPDRVASRLDKIVVAGREYSPFDPGLLDAIEQAAKVPEPDHLPELERQDRKLGRTFAVRNADQVIEVPMFRPVLRELPDFKSALMKDFEAFAQKAREAAKEERRRIVLLLMAE